MNGAGVRRKGHNYERQIARELRPIFGDSVRRGLQYRDGADAPDVIAGHYHIECKCGKKPGVRAALHQAIEASEGNGTIPVVFIKDTRGLEFVVMTKEDFYEEITDCRRVQNG